jgi:hypothetical protein
MGIDPTLVAGWPIRDEQLAEDADLAQRRELAKRFEAALVKLDELRAEIEDIATEVEIGP